LNLWSDGSPNNFKAPKRHFLIAREIGAMDRQLSFLSALTLTLLISTSAVTQQVIGTPGSPGATTSISGDQLPPPDPKFGGVIEDDALQSKPRLDGLGRLRYPAVVPR